MRNQIAVGLLVGMLGAGVTRADSIRASDPQGVALSVYDAGGGWVSELRRVALANGINEVRFERLPSNLDPATASFSALGAEGFEIKAQRFEFARGNPERLLADFIGQSITLRSGGIETKGVLMGLTGAPDAPFKEKSLILKSRDNADLIVRDMARLDEWVLPQAGTVYLDPVLLWTLQSKVEGPQNIRLNYLCDGLSWEAYYEMWLKEPDASAALLSVRAAVRNESDGRFQNARLRLVSTQQGSFPPLLPDASFLGGRRDAVSQTRRYAYGDSEPTLQRMAASATALKSYDLPDPVTLVPGVTTYVQIRQADRLPVRRLLVYDGVIFDRFQRNVRNDWNYGTEFQPAVEQYLQFSNSVESGLGMDLPPGRLRLYAQAEDGSIDLAGQAFLAGVPPGASVNVQVGPAQGLTGERERTGYAEVVPLHEYEESFEIRLLNETEVPANVVVVEHLYRGKDFQIVKADTEYQLTGPQTLEFPVEVKPGGKRSIHYTVRYSW